MKYEWKKSEKYLYGVKQKPEFIEVPTAYYIMIKGEGNPNESDFSNRVSALYSLAYGIKMLFKNMEKEELEYSDFTVFPLEGIWEKSDDEEFDKNKLKYTIMIKQPYFITKEIFELAFEKVKKKKPNELYDEVSFDCIESKKAIQILHIGSFDTEIESFEKLDNFANEMNLERSEKLHTEIYLNNKNRTAEDKLKTILRYNVK
ncbi:GyrI-like domain-containing protein [Parvimonas micra]|uniref:GyrI-like domain-containing protein n=2 Tax=Parvimonas micra TaxID=33033 RepID=A0A9X3HCK3_9FIRM|nr:GyrI-like domain-containing protein [Parvimonas micra]MCZ7408279.1 GyrI-like domain-containing protein [Parvimonas micra]MCZ7411198.1 GyrI-like domain-containing protein [Parvimonas micra]MCZ7412789.1 GyrI-like domain-containing protein [Parvimonas micra]WBB36876.1 GyrI-like domain-containing protein [Parvimonas micra]